MNFNDEIRKIKSKDARLTAIAHVDSDFACNEEVIDALKVTDRMTALRSSATKTYADQPPEKRAVVTALEVKIASLEQQYLNIAEEAEKIGIDSGKFIRNRRDYFKWKQRLIGIMDAVSAELGESFSVEEELPYIQGFLTR